jgi:hypothetical protein
MTMKMISNTSMTSTIGVTLMLALTLDPSFLTAIAIGLRSDRDFSGGGNQGPGAPEGSRLKKIPAQPALRASRRRMRRVEATDD